MICQRISGMLYRQHAEVLWGGCGQGELRLPASSCGWGGHAQHPGRHQPVVRQHALQQLLILPQSAHLRPCEPPARPYKAPLSRTSAVHLPQAANTGDTREI